jgi:hypothetical protein
MQNLIFLRVGHTSAPKAFQPGINAPMFSRIKSPPKAVIAGRALLNLPGGNLARERAQNDQHRFSFHAAKVGLLDLGRQRRDRWRRQSLIFA